MNLRRSHLNGLIFALILPRPFALILTLKDVSTHPIMVKKGHARFDLWGGEVSNNGSFNGQATSYPPHGFKAWHSIWYRKFPLRFILLLRPKDLPYFGQDPTYSHDDKGKNSTEAGHNSVTIDGAWERPKGLYYLRPLSPIPISIPFLSQDGGGTQVLFRI